MEDRDWGGALRSHLLDLGVPPTQAEELVTSSLADARSADSAARSLFGPASVYALALADSLGEQPEEHRVATRPGAMVLRLEEVTKSYRGRRALAPTSLTLRQGEIAAVVGANGSGKSTLLKICSGQVAATSGRIERVERYGYVPQADGLSPYLTVAEHLHLFGSAAGMTRPRAVSTGTHLCARLGWRARPTRLVSELSGGTRQKLSVALAELGGPRLLLLDEPYQGFDQQGYRRFWDQVRHWRDSGMGIVMVTHLLHDTDDVDHLVELESGEAA